jgi:hypothetical protein
MPAPVYARAGFGGLHDFARIGGSHKDLRQQCIGVERNRRQQLIQLFWFKRWVGAACLGQGLWRRGQKQDEADSHQACKSLFGL